MSILGWILGRRLANQEQSQRKMGVFEGVPAMGLDGLGSSAYGPEAALTVLIPLGAAGLGYIGPIMGAIVGLLAVLYLSYRQTIAAYPSNGGAYIVSRENLGRNASLLAASALMVDYVLNVAVGISAGVGALVSALPSLHPYTLWLCLGILLLVTVVNLRGTLDAGRLFALPTYLFVASFLAILAIGVWKASLSGGQPSPAIPPPPLPQPTASVSLLLLMHAFASGCTAMTGVEAVSNGMTAFKDPAVKHGRRTLAAICLILGLLLGGIAFLSARYRIGAMDQEKDGYQSVLSQLAHAVVGDGIFYYVAIGSLLCVLALSANTSFVDFPRLCRMVAEDGYLPRPFAMVGRRLVFSVGILYLGFATGLLLVVFGGITDHLIPLFAIGAFLTFTLSQTGMVLHWVRARRTEKGPEHAGHRMHLAVNALGGAITALALVVIVIAKFDLHAFGRRLGFDRSGALDDAGKHAFMLGVEVLNDHIGKAAIGRHLRKERLQGGDAARRCANADDREGGGRLCGFARASLRSLCVCLPRCPRHCCLTVLACSQGCARSRRHPLRIPSPAHQTDWQVRSDAASFPARPCGAQIPPAADVRAAGSKASHPPRSPVPP